MKLSKDFKFAAGTLLYRGSAMDNLTPAVRIDGVDTKHDKYHITYGSTESLESQGHYGSPQTIFDTKGTSVSRERFEAEHGENSAWHVG